MKDLHLLIQLQERDLAIDVVSEKISEFSNQIQTKKKEAKSLTNNLTSAKETLKGHQARKKAIEIEASEKDALIRKLHGQLNSLKTNEEYKAMLEEIKTAKEAFSALEDQELEVMESIEQAEKDLKEKEDKVKSDEGRIQDEIKNLEAEKVKVEEERKTKSDERSEFLKSIPENLSRHYENVRSRRGGMVLSPVVDGTCGECSMKITPNQMVQLKKGKTIEYCEQSNTILYLPEQAQEQKSDEPSVSAPQSK